MSEKYVIIDGVDVSGCEHYRAKLKYKLPFDDYTVEQDRCHYSGIEIIQNCKGIKDCIYKQLQRLKEEKQELSIEIVSLTSKLFTLEKSSNDLSQGINKLYKALQEIRKIAEELKSPHCTDCTQVLNKKGKCTGECMYDYKKIILDKINEVIGAE